jgi:hypothetical protein
MSVTKFPYGRPVKLLVDYQGYPDGRVVQFEIWRKKGSEEEKILELHGVTKGGKGIGRWIPRIERKETLPLEKEIEEETEEEKYYFIAKIDDQEVKSGEMVLTYQFDIYLKDEAGIPIDGAEYTITFSDGSKKQGLFENGRAEFMDAPVGRFKLELEEYEFVFGKIIKVNWDANKTKYGEKIKMLVDVEGFEDGTPAKFEIWKREGNGKNNVIERIDGKVQGNKVEAVWDYSPEEVEEDLKEKVEEDKEEPEYFFAVDIEGEEARSEILTFNYPIDIYLEDKNGNPLEGAEYKITLSDGTEIRGKFKKGHAKVEDAPYGKFSVEVQGYDFIFE